MKKLLIIIIFLMSGLCSQAQNNISNAGSHDKNNYLLVKHDYTLSYNDSLRHANWSAWTLAKSHIGMVERQNDFSIDATLPCFHK